VRFHLRTYDSSNIESNVSEVFSFNSIGLVTLATAGDAPLSIHFSSGTSFAPKGSIVSYNWSFGDGVTSKEPVIDHTFTASGIYTVTLTITDNVGATAQATTMITVNKPKNLPPKAIDLSLTTNRNITATGSLSASDPEGAPLVYRIVTNGSKGLASITNPTTGSFTYVPTHNITGNDYFTFIATDGTLDSNLATVSVVINQINHPPQPSPLAITVAENSTVTGTLLATDADNDILTYSLLTTGTLGSAVLTNAQTGSFTYTPKANVYGTDSFTFIANDGSLKSSSTTVSVTITKVNHTPITFDDTAITEINKMVTIDVLANDSTWQPSQNQ
jgi:PKD repeat protein